MVGAPYDDVGANTTRARPTSSCAAARTWSQQAKLTAADGAAGDFFGYSVAISGDTALVGAAATTSAPTQTRARPTSSCAAAPPGASRRKLTAADGAADDYFGYSVALSGDTAVVGAACDDVGANANQGSAYVFVRSGTHLEPAGAADRRRRRRRRLLRLLGRHLGRHRRGRGRHDDVGANVDQGSAYVFVRSGTTWSQQAKLTAADGAAGD